MFSIRPTYLLTAMGNGTTIDGASQTAFTGNTNTLGPEIALDGTQIAAAGLYAHGLILRAASCVIKGLTITNFNQSGILAFHGTDPNGSPATGNVIGNARGRDLLVDHDDPSHRGLRLRQHHEAFLQRDNRALVFRTEITSRAKSRLTAGA